MNNLENNFPERLRDGRFTDIMIDLETLDTKDSTAILTIAAQAFNIETGEVCPVNFYARLNYERQIQEGRTISVDTALWWGQQSEEAREEAFGGHISLWEALVNLRKYFEKHCYTDRHVWAKAPVFDLATLKHAYNEKEQEVYWHYSNERDVRTYMWSVQNLDVQLNWVKTHVSREDVSNQIDAVCQVYQIINSK
ncbi:3'-5' exonuclease [Sphingobacterium multivorum]|uniref:3'-5' exonuclease n=1 Tax=Sphingobacterium multivorum TaxID=28454 RepID=UPI003DA36F36